MKYFDVRQSGELSRQAPWPEAPPSLRVLEVPPRLQVPLAARPQAGALAHRPAGSVVAKGDRLSVLGAPGSAMALSPTSGRVVGTSQVQLLNGMTVPALDIEADFED